MPANPMTMQPLTDSEGEWAANVIGAVIDEAGVRLDASDQALLDHLPRSIRDRGGESWGVVVEGTFIGTISIYPAGKTENESEWVILFLALVPKWRGMGIGRMLAETAIEYARDRGASRIRIELAPHMEAAFELFLSLQFRDEGAGEPGERTKPFLMRRIFPTKA